MADQWRGIFPVLLTPFRENGTIDAESLRREVDFAVQAGAHGLVTPVNTSEFYLLSEKERQRLAEVVIDQADGRVPVIIGTAAPSTDAAQALTRHAREAGAAGVIAMPPYVVRMPPEAIVDYYARISEAADGLPLVLQNVEGEVGSPLSPQAVLEIAQQVPAVRYVKDETLPSTHRISGLLKVAGDHLDGVFGGSWGRFLINELQRGACGLMSGSHLVDAQVKVYDLWQQGRHDEAREVFVRQLPVQNLWSLLGLRVAKEVLRRRGVFRTNICRRACASLDEVDHAELDAALALVEGDLTARM
jgi:dihydrodipicolinate synthase/N-acetylneuraminate lyase